MKDPLSQYYIHQADCGTHNEVGPIYSVPHFLQRGHGVGSFLSGLFRTVRPVLWIGVKAVVRETLRTGGKILSDLADNRSGDVKHPHIIAKPVNDSAQNLIQKLRGKGRERTATEKARGIQHKKKAEKKTAKATKRDIFHRTYNFVSDHGCGRSVSKH